MENAKLTLQRIRPSSLPTTLLSLIERVSLRPLSSDALQLQIPSLYSKSIVVFRETDNKNTFITLGTLPSP